jgi:hypothetical protein
VTDDATRSTSFSAAPKRTIRRVNPDQVNRDFRI